MQPAGRALVGFSPAMATADRDIKAFLFANMYRHPQVTRVRERADAVVRRLFSAYVADPAAMPAGLGGQGRRRPKASGRAPPPIISPA